MRGLEAAGGVVARIDRTPGVTGGLRRDAADIEAYATILQRGERVLNRRETAGYERGHFGAPLVVNLHVRDAESFRQSRPQVASDIARAVAFGRRGM